MTDDPEMRFRLQQIVAYRQLCQSIRGTGRGNVFFAAVMGFLAYLAYEGGAPDWLVFLYGGLALAELGVGLFKWVAPSAEGILFDALLLLLFAGFKLGIEALVLLNGQQPRVISILIGVWLLSGAVSRFKNYADLRRAFADRPTRDQLAWFDDLVREIRAADPETDDLALDLPTHPHWKAKLLGTTAFFVARRGPAVVVAGPGDFAILPEEADRRTGRPRALLLLHAQAFPAFEIGDATWDNYRKWAGEARRA